jgi:hypothetical protein
MHRPLMNRLLPVVLLLAGAMHAAAIDTTMVFRAMRAEMDRTMRELRLGNLAVPYYVEYTLSLRQRVGMHATLGSITDVDTSRVALLTTKIRVGDTTFDNTNFFDVSLGFFGSSDDEEGYRNRRIPFELTEQTLRRELWLSSDACFKQAVEIYAKKQAAVANRTRTDTTQDFRLLPSSHRSDTRHQGTRVNLEAWKQSLERASSAMRAYPSIQVSRVGMEYVPEEIFYCTSEGRTAHKIDVFSGVELVAIGQADDGMPVGMTYSAYGLTPEDLPSPSALEAAAKRASTVFDSVRRAATIEAYSGPVLFQGKAAGALLGQFLVPNLCAQRQPLSDGGFSMNDRSMAFQNKIGARVVPEFLSISATPSRERSGLTAVAGHYSIDDEGMPAQDVQLVDKGYLRALLSTRVPTKRVKESNGHQRGGGPMPSVIEVTNNDIKRRLSPAALKTRLLKLVKDRALPYGMIVRQALDQNILMTGIIPLVGLDYTIPQGEGKMGLLEVVRVFPDGREELVRGTELAGMSAPLFKDILATGQTSTVHNYLAPAVSPSFLTGGSAYGISTVITPDLLFEDVEIRPVEGDFANPPFLANPITE